MVFSNSIVPGKCTQGHSTRHRRRRDPPAKVYSVPTVLLELFVKMFTAVLVVGVFEFSEKNWQNLKQVEAKYRIPCIFDRCEDRPKIWGLLFGLCLDLSVEKFHDQSGATMFNRLMTAMTLIVMYKNQKL